MATRTVVLSAARKWDGEQDRVGLNAAYVSALESAGLVPVILPPLANAAGATEVVAQAAGLVLTGGGDLNPSLYGEELHHRANPPEDDRDATELAMIAGAREAGVPTLAICRGIQALNIALGGSVIQDIPSQVNSPVRHDSGSDRKARAHEIRIEPGSRLARAVGATCIRVNSLHHQAVGRLAPGLRATAHSEDGLVEGLESGDDWWMIGVQWHPEEMHADEEPWDRALFQSFARAVLDRG